MWVEFDSRELKGLLGVILPESEFKPKAIGGIRIDKIIAFSFKTQIGTLVVGGQFDTTPDGDLVFDISQATIGGLGLFGIVRKKANEEIVKILRPLLRNGHIFRNPKGNLQLHIDGIEFKRARVREGKIELSIDLHNVHDI